jgi:hypothetical protein
MAGVRPDRSPTIGGVTLMAKAVAVADLWRFRTGQGRDLSLDVRRVPHRLCPFYDGEWAAEWSPSRSPPEGFPNRDVKGEHLSRRVIRAREDDVSSDCPPEE